MDKPSGPNLLVAGRYGPQAEVAVRHIQDSEQDENSLFVWLLFEHQSVQDPMIAVRLIEYALSRWRAFRGMNPESRKIPAVLPIVIQHDPKDWTGSAYLSDLYMGRDILRRIVGPHLIDFKRYEPAPSFIHAVCEAAPAQPSPRARRCDRKMAA